MADPIDIVLGAAATIITGEVTVIGVLILRAIGSFDRRLGKVEEHLEAEKKKNTDQEVWRAEITLRVTRLELDVAELKASQERKAG